MGNLVYLYKGGNNMSREISVFDVANTFLCFESMTHKKLQKLCYYAQAWYLALYDEPLFDGEFQAWVHGPVSPELYSKYSYAGWSPIEKDDIQPKLNSSDIDFINIIYNTFGEFSGDELEIMTHMEDPWLNAREGLKEYEPSRNIISEDDMKSFYRRLREQSQED